MLARGDAAAVAPFVREAAAFVQRSGRIPWDDDVLTELELAVMLDDQPGALETARSYLARLDECDSPLTRPRPHGSGSRPSAWLGRPLGPDRRTRTWHFVSSARAQCGLTTEWRPTYYGVQLALAEAYAARLAGQPAVAEFGEAARLAGLFGAFFELEPRLNLATELLAHGGRDEGRELLVACWSSAHDMGAHDLERRALRLATRTRVVLPQAASREGPLSRLTPREREVLDLLVTGATNKTIAATLVITEKTASVHVSNLLAKLGVANRGSAAALARDLVG